MPSSSKSSTCETVVDDFDRAPAALVRMLAGETLGVCVDGGACR